MFLHKEENIHTRRVINFIYFLYVLLIVTVTTLVIKNFGYFSGISIGITVVMFIYFANKYLDPSFLQTKYEQKKFLLDELSEFKFIIFSRLENEKDLKEKGVSKEKFVEFFDKLETMINNYELTSYSKLVEILMNEPVNIIITGNYNNLRRLYEIEQK